LQSCRANPDLTAEEKARLEACAIAWELIEKRTISKEAFSKLDSLIKTVA